MPTVSVSGRFMVASSGGGSHDALVAAPYADRRGLKVGSKLDLNGTVFTVVGLVRPPLGGQTADVYVALPQLQALASQQSAVNVVLSVGGVGLFVFGAWAAWAAGALARAL